MMTSTLSGDPDCSSSTPTRPTTPKTTTTAWTCVGWSLKNVRTESGYSFKSIVETWTEMWTGTGSGPETTTSFKNLLRTALSWALNVWPMWTGSETTTLSSFKFHLRWLLAKKQKLLCTALIRSLKVRPMWTGSGPEMTTHYVNGTWDDNSLLTQQMLKNYLYFKLFVVVGEQWFPQLKTQKNYEYFKLFVVVGEQWFPQLQMLKNYEYFKLFTCSWKLLNLRWLVAKKRELRSRLLRVRPTWTGSGPETTALSRR